MTEARSNSSMSSIVYEVTGTILFFMKRFYPQKKILKKHINKYTLTKHSNKRLLFTFVLFMLFKRIISFFMKIYMQTYEEKST